MIRRFTRIGKMCTWHRKLLPILASYKQTPPSTVLARKETKPLTSSPAPRKASSAGSFNRKRHAKSRQAPYGDLFDKRQFGYSRDKRPDCVQVVIGLIITPEGAGQ
jgi:hypothetical protein